MQDANRCAIARCRRTQRHAAARQPLAELLEAVRQRHPAHRMCSALIGDPALGVLAVSRRYVLV